MIFVAFPDSFNELRARLSNDHQDLWEKVSFVMVNKQELFIEIMNHELQEFLVMPYDGLQDIDTCCKGWLRALERRKPYRTMTATETIDPRNVDKEHRIEANHRPKSMFEDCETSGMTEQQIDEARKKGYNR